MMTSSQIRQSFLDFFKSKQHTIVPSSSLMPDSPNLLFTNAGMNQFVPIFLGQVKCPYTPGRAADTQKCIRAGGKHNDLDDVGLDTYHHTFFEMLGNWSFGDYFKKEAIGWAWELVVEVWKFPPQRIYATVYCPHMDMERWKRELTMCVDAVKAGPIRLVWDDENPNESAIQRSDRVSAQYWAKYFLDAGLDPMIHVIPGNKKDNFWMMGETGPCGPCTEVHVDLRPGPVQTDLESQKSGMALVNGGDARCIEIWNNVFIQFNANPDGTFSPLPAQHVDTGMGFERVTSIIQGTKGLTDFQNAKISNYETDVFRPIFDAIEKLSGKKYGSTLPKAGSTGDTEQEKIDVAFRVIADHIRTLSFAIADGIQPGNTDRNYVLRRILRRAVRYGRTLGFHEPFFFKLVDVLADTMGDIFPEIRAKKKHVQEVLKVEEEAFNKTLDKGIEIFEGAVSMNRIAKDNGASPDSITWYESIKAIDHKGTVFGEFAFKLYDTYGFPLDLTELMARERGLTVEKEGFEKLMEDQRNRARAAQKKEVITINTQNTNFETKFIGYETSEAKAKVLSVLHFEKKDGVIVDVSPFYAEMGGQVGDAGVLVDSNGTQHAIKNTTKIDKAFVLHTEVGALNIGDEVTLQLDLGRRSAIQRHHTVTHLLHWALHEEFPDSGISQKGSFVGPDKLTFDFNSAALTPEQVDSIEKRVNKCIVKNDNVSWTEVSYAEVKKNPKIMQFFGDKYGDTVRVVQIGGSNHKLDGYSMELCGGTHTRATGEIGLFRIVSENAVAAGVRRIEAVAGLTAYDVMKHDRELIKSVAGKVNAPIHELDKKIEALLAQQKELEKSLKAAIQRNAAQTASWLLTRVTDVNGIPLITQLFPESDGDYLQAIVDAVKSRFKGVIVVGGFMGGSVTLIANVSSDFTAKVQAGKIIQTIAPIVGGKGGGKPDNARGGGKDASKLEEALAKVKSLLG